MTADDIESISGTIPNKVVINVENVVNKSGVTYSDIQKLAEDLILEGYDC